MVDPLISYLTQRPSQPGIYLISRTASTAQRLFFEVVSRMGRSQLVGSDSWFGMIGRFCAFRPCWSFEFSRLVTFGFLPWDVGFRLPPGGPPPHSSWDSPGSFPAAFLPSKLAANGSLCFFVTSCLTGPLRVSLFFPVKLTLVQGGRF